MIQDGPVIEPRNGLGDSGDLILTPFQGPIDSFCHWLSGRVSGGEAGSGTES